MADPSDVAKIEPIRTVADMFRTLEAEINLVKSGAMALDTARVIQRSRGLQIKLVEVNLRAQRQNKAVRNNGSELNVLTGLCENVEAETKVV